MGGLEPFLFISGLVGRSVNHGFAPSTSSCCSWHRWVLPRNRWATSCGPRCRPRTWPPFSCFWPMRDTGRSTPAWRTRSFAPPFTWQPSSPTLSSRSCCCGCVSEDWGRGFWRAPAGKQPGAGEPDVPKRTLEAGLEILGRRLAGVGPMGSLGDAAVSVLLVRRGRGRPRRTGPHGAVLRPPGWKPAMRRHPSPARLPG